MLMPYSSGFRYKSTKAKSTRLDKFGAQKKTALKKKTQNFTQLITLTVLSIVSIIFLSLYFVNKNINKNFAYAENSSNLNSDFYSFTYFTIDDKNSDTPELKKLSFVLIDKISNKTLILDFPINLTTNIDSRFVDTTFEQLFKLTGLKNDDKLLSGVESINLQILKILGVYPEKFILVDQSMSKDFDELLYDGNKNFVLSNIIGIYNNSGIKTDISLLDLLSIQSDLNDRVSQDTKNIILNETTVNDENFLNSLFDIVSLSSLVAQEKKTISVLNGSGISGVAGFGARVVRNNGGRVVSIDNASHIYENSVLIVEDKNSETTNFLKNTFNINNVYEKSEVSLDQEDSIQRSDTTLIIGIDFAELVY